MFRGPLTAKTTSDTRRFGFPPASRIKKKSDFARLKVARTKLHSRHFLLLIEPSASGANRLGVTVSTKVDKRAVARNRIRRVLKEIFRLNRHRFTQPFDIVIIARKNAVECSSKDIQREVLGALFHAKLLAREGK